MSSLANSTLSNLTKAELLQDLDTATIELRHSRHAFDIERHETLLGEVIGELNYRFTGWQHEFYTPTQVAALVAAGAVIAPALADQVPYEKEFMTCSLCHKYKGCWTDSEVCSDCDEAADERKMADNEALEAEPATRYSHTAPPAKNGLLHLALGFPLIIALAVLVNSCAAPARLPMGPVVQHAQHDPRTKLVEPTPLKPR